ncbi:hypothetical protein AB0953_04760 [Streptomyces sp. NPDC046866]|uniref:hypothetical protein n=1 Tax=Streptomyces sp. NPDC046866 TaxID=3154921 RepID=UPI0034552023
MDIAALATWLITALGGFFMLGVWIRHGGVRRRRTGGSRLPAPVLFGHFVLAAAGLVVWIAYLAVDRAALAWTAFGLLVPVALLGFTMLARWLPVLRARTTDTGPDAQAPAERHFPVPVVIGHGLFAVATVLLVLLSALGTGGN